MTPGKRTRDGEHQTFDFGVNIPGVQPPANAKDQSFKASHKGKSVLTGTPSIDHLNSSYTGKGKAHALFDTEDRERTSKESEDSHNSVESCNSKRLMSRGKRVSNYHLKIPIENKRSKKQIFKDSSSNFLLRQTGSFVNWALAITKGFSQFCEATPLASAPPLSNQVEGNLDCRSVSHVDGKDVSVLHGDMGFKSIFESIYLPGSNVKNSTTANVETVRELRVEGEQFGYGNNQIHCKNVELNLQRMRPTKSDMISGASKYHSPSGSVGRICDKGGDDLHNEVSLTEERLDEHIHHGNEFLSTKSDVFGSNSRFHKKMNCDPGPTGDLDSIGSTCSTPKNGCPSSPGKRAGAIVTVSESSTKLVPQNKAEHLQNLWITRFCPKVSSSTAKHMQCVDLGSQSSTKSYNALESVSQNDAESSKDQGCSVNGYKMNLTAVKRWECMKIGDEKFKSILDPMLPSYKVQKMEMAASSFAKRLDVLRRPEHSEVPDNVTLSTTICLFCGKGSHGMRACT